MSDAVFLSERGANNAGLALMGGDEVLTGYDVLPHTTHSAKGTERGFKLALFKGDRVFIGYASDAQAEGLDT